MADKQDRHEVAADPEPPKWSVLDDTIRITKLVDKLRPNWKRDEDKAIVRHFFRQLALEV